MSKKYESKFVGLSYAYGIFNSASSSLGDDLD